MSTSGRVTTPPTRPAEPTAGHQSVAMLGLWTVTGLAWVLTLMGMLSIGIFVLPLAVGLLVFSIIRTTSRPDSWPAIAGLGVALSVGVAWLGWTLATSGPSELSCSGGSDIPTICTSGGKVIDPDAVVWSVATPWLALAGVIALLTVVAYFVARRVVANTTSSALGVGT